MPDRPQAVGDVPEAVVPQPEQAIAGARVNLGRKSRAQLAVELAIELLAVGGRKRHVERAERGHPAGEIARREIAGVELARLDHGRQVGCTPSLLGHVGNDLERERRAQPRAQRRGKLPERLRVNRGIGLIAAKAQHRSRHGKAW